MQARGAQHGMDPARLARIPEFLESAYLAPGKLPCAMVLVERRGEIALWSVQGKADPTRDRPLERDTIVRIYSMTKPIASLALMMLVEEGRIALDDPVHRYIPEWRNLRVFAGGVLGAFQTTATTAPMRVVDLLRHTAGLTYGFQNRGNVDAAYRALKLGDIGQAMALDEMIGKLGELPLEFSPGEAWNYSVATDVVGWLVQQVSGQPFECFLADRILAPLGMSDTGFHVRDGEAHRFAACYAHTPSGRTILQDDPQTSRFLEPPSFVSGGGGLVSTMQDYLQFCRMLLAGGTLGGHRFISRKTLDLMTANHLPGGVDLPALSRSLFSEASYQGVGFGLGFATTIDAAQTLLPGSHGDFFWGGMASTFFWVDPAEDLIGIFLTQLMPSSTYPVRRQLRTLVYAAIDD